MSKKLSFLVLVTNSPWVYALTEALTRYGSVTAVRFYDWNNYRRLKPAWPKTTACERRVVVTLPPGYAGRLEPLFRPILRRFVTRERAKLRLASGVEPITICSYPYIVPWVRSVPSEQLVYLNYDDYTLYNPARAARTTELEDELIRRARLTLCASQHQTSSLRARHADFKHRIVHFPNGVLGEYLNLEPGRPPLAATVGYVGNLSNRVDWSLVEQVVKLMPEVRFHFVGSLAVAETGAETRHWQKARSRTFSLSNVVYEGAVAQEHVKEHYWRYAVNWMPYATDHPFNIASCPTKIMDALASGRPFVSTDIPEVRLYRSHIPIFMGTNDAVRMLRALLALGSEHDAPGQIEFASTQTWDCRAQNLVGRLQLAKLCDSVVR